MIDRSLSLLPFLLCFFFLLTLTLLPTSIDARTDGADAASCDDQDPRGKLDSQHTGNLKTTGSPFIINIASGANPNDGDPISITISTTSGNGFAGFLISALPSSQVALGSGYNGKRLGSWSSPSTSIVQPRCQQSGIVSALTHTSSNTKKTLPLIWTPPSVPSGTTLPNITIIATFVINTNDAYIVSTQFAVTPTGPSQPSLPLNPQAIAATNTSLTISWTSPKRSGSQPITNYIIQIDSGSESADTSQQIITPRTKQIDTQSTNTTYTITGLISGYTYRIQVAAKNGVPGETLFTDLFAARVLRNTIRPPGIVSMNIPISTITSTSAIITWNTPDLAGETLVSYELQRAVNGDLENAKTMYKGTNLNFTDTTIIANTAYQYRIITTTLAGSTASPYTNITAKPCPNNCSGKGICGSDGRCICKNGIMGSDCSLNANTLCMGGNRMCMQWAVSTIESYVYVRLIGPSKTWFGVILDPDEIDGMKAGDAWIANVGQDTSIPTVADMYSSGRVDPNGDFRESDLEWITSTSRNNTAIAFTFRRKLDTTDVQDRMIKAGTVMRLSWAIGGELNLKQHKRGDYGKAHIDWVAGTAYELDYSLKYGSFYLPIIIGLGVVILTGLLLQYPSIYRSTLGRFLLRSRIPPPWIASTPMDKLTLDFRPSLLTLSFGEIGVILTYLICMAAMIGHGYKQMMEINRDGRYIWGHVTAVHIALTWLPMTKHSVWLYVFGISFERAIRFHRWIARMTMIMMYIHLGTMIVIWDGSIITSTYSTYGGNGVIYGFIAFLVFQSIMLLAIEPIRRYAYEWFLYPHMILSKAATVLAMIHSTYLRWYMLVPLILYGWDWLIRMFNEIRYTSIIESMIHMSGTSPISDAPHEDKIEPGVTVLKVKVPSSFRYHGGDYVYMNIPSISATQWHPFSISSYPTATSPSDTETLTFHILDMGTGTYTNDLAKMATSLKSGSTSQQTLKSGSTSQQTQVKIDGPYGRLMIPIMEYPHLILVAGGVGATPIISILGSLFTAYQSGQLSHLRSCDIIWISRSSHALQSWWKPLFTSIIAHGVPFRFHLYCTTQDPKHRPLIQIRPSVNASAAAVAVVVADDDGTSTTRMDENGLKTAPPSPPFVSTPPSDASAVATIPHIHDSIDNNDIPIIGGRPNLPQLIREIHTSRNGSSSSSSAAAAAVPIEYAGNKWGVAACGPPALITTTRQLAYQLNCDWHEETFTI